MHNHTIIRLVLFGSLAILGIIVFQTYWVINTWNVKEQEFHERANFALIKVAKEFEKLGNQIPTYDLINRISTNYYVVNINDVINPNNLQYFLRRELEAVGLTEDFEYGIYDCATNKMVYGDYISYSSPVDPRSVDKQELPIYDEYTYYFGVRFTKRATHILSSMGATILFSTILTVTIIFFLYSMFVILRQKRLSEMQKDFINNMTHEFKTPISTIKISADVFLNHPKVLEDPRLEQYAQIIRDQNHRLNKQVEKVLQLAKIERENFQLSLETFDLHLFLQEVIPSVQLKVASMGGNFQCELGATQHEVEADRLHLSNILHNLLDNAVKYCADIPVITVRTEDRPQGLALTVADQGLGIAPEYQAKVFNKFYRIPTGNVHNVKGFGLGLYYIASICQAHGWKIILDSQLEKGSSFTLLIPPKRPVRNGIKKIHFLKERT